MASPLKRISQLIQNEDDFLVVAHYNPDGDAIGSICGVGHILKQLGKKFILYSASGLPNRYDFVNAPGPIIEKLPETMPAWTIVLDCGARDRMGEELVARMNETKIINMDHHLGNDEFGVENWVAVDQPAVGSMVALLAKELDIELVGPLAECVYLAVSTDTGFFTYGSTTPESMELAADMLRNGLDTARMNMLITKQWSINRMHLWTEVTKGIEMYHHDKVGVIVVTKEMFQKTGTTSDDTENLINFVRRLKTVRVAAILREEGVDNYKFSLRSYGDDNVQAIAAVFDGGGHKNASGGTINAPLADAKAQLVKIIGESLGL